MLSIFEKTKLRVFFFFFLVKIFLSWKLWIQNITELDQLPGGWSEGLSEFVLPIQQQKYG